MAKQFAGFTQQQTELLARKMGFNGPMEQFQNFLKSDPGLQNKYSSYESKAKQMVEGAKEKRGFATGGLVNDSAATQGNITTTLNKSSTTNSIYTPNQNSEGMQITNEMINNPSQHVSEPNTSQIGVSQNELVDRNAGQSSGTEDVTASTVGQVGPINTTNVEASTGTSSEAAAPETKDAVLVDPKLVTEDVKTVVDNTQAAQGTVSNQALMEAITANPSVNATVQGQLASLMGQFEDGKVPAWAAGALRNVNTVMGSRGLGASSMAAGAATQAAMESALEIAVRDATTYGQFEMQNLNNRQQAALQNAQSFLQMDLMNVSNEQQMALAKMQTLTSAMFSDQAATNAAQQFNASSQMQTDQFFSQLASQTAQFNAAQNNAMEQFNTGQINTVALDNANRTDSMSQFTASLNNSNSQFNAQQINATEQFNRQVNEAREQFNAANRLIIDQSNAEWRRQVTTTNNAEANENARLTAQMQTNMTTAAYNNFMQRERDEYSFMYQSTENALQRATDMVMARYTASQASKTGVGQALGNLAGSLIDGIFSK